MKWWLVTWSTYGSWLPGDPRGFQTWRGRDYVPPPKRYATPGEKSYDPAKYAGRYEEAKAVTGAAVKLTAEQRRITSGAFVAEIAKLPIVPSIMAVSNEHGHLLAKFGALKIRRTVGVLKGEATKALHRSGHRQEDFWGKECHMKSKKEGREFRVAFDYVHRHLDDGAIVYVWPVFRHLVSAVRTRAD